MDANAVLFEGQTLLYRCMDEAEAVLSDGSGLNAVTVTCGADGGWKTGLPAALVEFNVTNIPQ